MRTGTMLLLAALGGPLLLPGHEIGTTRVSVLLEEGARYDIRIVTDAAALSEKLGVAPAGLDAAALEQALSASTALFRSRVKIAFDGVEAAPGVVRFEVQPPADAADAGAVSVRLGGAVPAGARELNWSYGWTFATYALMARGAGAAGEPVTQWLEGGQTSAPIPVSGASARGAGGTVRRYLVLGFTHIVPGGLDHVLFVLGIWLLSRRARTVLWQVSAFTLAHSITLALNLYGLVAVPSRIVEPLIAVSIAYVAIENVFLSELRRWRVALVFAFGLLHGLGFAGVLRELGLPRGEFATALVSFNLGVEAGQMAVIAAAFLLVGWHWSQRTWYRARIVIPASCAIACVALYWTVERLWA